MSLVVTFGVMRWHLEVFFFLEAASFRFSKRTILKQTFSSIRIVESILQE
mgnify:FL=1